jgi:hypothetical protein
MNKEETNLLFYIFLMKNKAFQRYILSKADQDVLLLPLLQVLYSTLDQKDKYSQLYTLLSCLLMTSQDEFVNQTIQKIASFFFKNKFPLVRYFLHL